MARKIPYDTSIDALLRPAKNAAYFDNWNTEDISNHDLLCAEMSRLAYAQPNTISDSLKRIGFQLVTRIGGEDPATRIATAGTDAFIARDSAHRLSILAFRGTESDKLEDIITDAMTFQVGSPMFPGCRVHAGFADRFARIKNRLPNPIAPSEDSLLITGHSLGGALATLAAAGTKSARLVTFGSPLVGDAEFRKLFQGMEVHRYVDCCDVVARIPPARFDQSNLRQLLTELGVPDAAARLIAGPIAGMFALADKTLEFGHVSKPRCILANGSVAEVITEADFTSNQKQARENYPHRLDLSYSSLSDFGKALGNLLNPLDALRAVMRKLTANLAHVPSRDLADHAPINYLSAFTGR